MFQHTDPVLTAKEKEIAEHLKEKHRPDIILLGGSRAAGTSHEGSDWDLHLFGDYPEHDFAAEQFKGNHLDVALVPHRLVEGDVYRIYFGPLPHLKVLFDGNERQGERIVQATRAAYLAGPLPLSSMQLQQNEGELMRSLQKIESYAGDGVACFYHLGNFYRLAVQQWFEHRGEWSMPPHKSSPYIRGHDPEFFELLERISGSASTADRVRAARDVSVHLWSGYPGLK